MEQVMNYLPWIGVAIVVVVLVLLVRWILSLRRVVKPSEVHVVRRSKVTEIYGSIKPIDSGAGNNAGGGISRADETAGNVYYQIPSWVPVWGVEVQILPLHNFSVDLDGYEAYDLIKDAWNRFGTSASSTYVKGSASTVYLTNGNICYRQSYNTYACKYSLRPDEDSD